MRALLLALALGGPLFGQFELQVVENSSVRTAPAVYDFGQSYLNQTLSARFRLRNVTSANATVSTIAAAGVGFTVTIPPLPVTVDPQVALEFTVNFRGPDLGSYSAVLRAANITILLTASVEPRLTYRVEDAPLPATVEFGSVQRGGTVRRSFTVINETSQLLSVPAISIAGTDFVFPARPPSGTLLGVNQSAGFAVDFAPSSVGSRQATLILGDRSVLLAGIAVDPPLPHPILSVSSNVMASAQQGALTVTFDKSAASAGTGLATLDFRGSADPTVAFAGGGRTISFQVRPGDTGTSLPFQTGTTVGTLVFTVRLGDAVDTISVQIAPVAPALTLVEAVRATGSIEIRMTGWDNVHSVSQLGFTFYDAAGSPIPPGTIRMDGSAEFNRYYAVSDLGGAFLLRAIFPVTGDAAQVASFDVSLSGQAGTVKSARTLIR